MATVTNSTIDADILKVVVDQDSAISSIPIARALLALGFTDKQQSEIHKLLDKNNAGTISPREHRRLEGYVRVGNFLNLVQARARKSLPRRKSAKR